jgi:hypothetical protein
VHGVDALSVTSKPSAPVVSVVSVANGSKKGKVNVTVSFALASTNAKAPLILTQVKVGTGSCTAVKKSSKCTVRNVVSGKTYKVQSRSKNRNGFGRWSSAVAVKAVLGNKWQRNNSSDNPATSTPASGVSTTVPGGVSTIGLKFNLKNAVGLIMKSSVSAASIRKSAVGSNLQAVDTAGNTTDAVTSGSASISRFLIAPNDKLYVLFNTKTAVGTVSCLLAEVDKTTGEPICIESDMQSISWDFLTGKSTNPPIQFDSNGAIYYAGTPSRGGNFELKKFAKGQSTSLINENMRLFDMLVLPDSSILISGETTSSGTRWIRKISPSGSLSNIASDQAYFMRRFPDGNIYFALYGQGLGIKRYLTEGSSVDSRAWMASVRNGAVNPHNDTDSLCYPSWSDQDGFCVGNFGIYIKEIVNTVSGSAYAVAGSGGSQGTLVRYFPTLTRASTQVKRVVVMQRVIDYLILTGLDANGQNITTLYNTATDTEQTLISSTNEIEMYHLNYVASSNKIMFDGLRFSDNKYVIGQIDLNTATVTASQTGSSKLLDFQTFGS